jgi:hypothetical protein
MMADDRAGPWASVIAHDEAFASQIAGVAVDEYVSVLEQSRDALFPPTHEAPGATPEQLRALDVPVFIAPGDDQFHAPSAAEYLAGLLPRAEKWVPAAEQNGEALIAQLVSFLDREAGVTVR